MIEIKDSLFDAINLQNTKVVDLVCIANIEVGKSVIDKTILNLENNIVSVGGEINIDSIGSYIVMGEEISKIASFIYNSADDTTDITLERRLYGTEQDDSIATGLHLRKVVLFNDIKSFSITDKIGDMKNVFPVEVSSGSISIFDDIENWSLFSSTKKYFLKKKQSPVYIFKGIVGSMVLKYTYFTDGKEDNVAVKNRQAYVNIKLKSKLNLWYNEKIRINQQIKNTTPKDFFSIIFSEEVDNIYYANGNVESDFIEVNNIHTKEYDTYSSLLKTYCATGVRFTFDRFEKIKIFTDLVVDNITSCKTIEKDIFDIKTNTSNQIIYNSIETNISEKLPIYDFDDFGGKYIYYTNTLASQILASDMFELDGNGDYQAIPIDITSSEMSSKMEIGDYAVWRFTSVTLGRTVEIMLRATSKVTNTDGDAIVRLYPSVFDKDKALYYRGKLDNVIVPLINEVASGDVLFGRVELPTVWKFTRSLETGDSNFNLKYPILPKIDGVEQVGNYTIYATMGTTENLEVGTYAGYCEEIDPIYGSWSGGSDLLYFNETYQFDGSKPPIGILSNKIDDSSTDILKYSTFDNSDLEIEVTSPTNGSGDAVIEIKNNMSVSSSLIIEDEPISMLGYRILEVNPLDEYKLGDVLIVNEPDSETADSTDIKLYDETLYKIKWNIISVENTDTQKFIYLDSDFPTNFSFKKFPRSSIIHLQEMYILGNPVIEYTSEVGGTATDMDENGYLSSDLYGTQNYDMEVSGMADAYDTKVLAGYILDNYNGSTTGKTKFLLPVQTSLKNFNLELLDVVEINEPIFTKIGLGTKWVIVSEGFTDSKSGIKVSYTMQNLNSENAKPFDMDISQMLSYEPVELPTYDSGGQEGEVSDGQDGEGINKTDSTVGEVWLSEVSTTEFVGKIYDFDNDSDIITLYDFGGTLVNDYLSVFFNDSEYIEFGLKIEDEMFFVKNILKDDNDNYRCEILKRQLYDTPKMVDVYNNNKDKKVSFYVVTTSTKSDGTFYARKVHIGDGDTYFKFHPVSGAEFQGTFLVKDTGENIGDTVLSIVDGDIDLNANTSVTGELSVYDENGITTYNASSESLATKKTVVKGGAIFFYERSSP